MSSETPPSCREESRWRNAHPVTAGLENGFEKTKVLKVFLNLKTSKVQNLHGFLGFSIFGAILCESYFITARQHSLLCRALY